MSGSSFRVCMWLNCVACGIQFPDQGSNPGPQQGQRCILSTDRQGIRAAGSSFTLG